MKLLPEHTQRLSRLVHRPGGLSVNEAVAAAEQNLLGLRDRGQEEVAATLNSMTELLAADGARTELYRMSNLLVAIASVAGQEGLGRVAFSLCTLLDGLPEGRGAGAIQLHMDSLRLLHAGAPDDAYMAEIISALRRVVDKALPKP